MTLRKLPREVHVVRGTLARARNVSVALPEKVKERIPFAEWASDAQAFTRERFVAETSQYLHDIYGIGTAHDRHVLMLLADQMQVYIDARSRMDEYALVVGLNDGKTLAPNPCLAIANKAMDNIIKLMNELGLTPKSRLTASKVDEVSPYAELLKGYSRA